MRTSAATSPRRCATAKTSTRARAKVAFGNYLSGIQMCVGCCTSEHSLEHAMSAYHQELPHGAGLIMISLAYYEFFIKKGVAPERFVRMAQAMGMTEASKPEDFLTALANLQRECGVDGLKMSDYGITPDEFEKMTNLRRWRKTRWIRCAGSSSTTASSSPSRTASKFTRSRINKRRYRWLIG